MTEHQYWDLSERVTNPEFGCPPEDRSLENLLNSGVILVQSSPASSKTCRFCHRITDPTPR